MTARIEDIEARLATPHYQAWSARQERAAMREDLAWLLAEVKRGIVTAQAEIETAADERARASA